MVNYPGPDVPWTRIAEYKVRPCSIIKIFLQFYPYFIHIRLNSINVLKIVLILSVQFPPKSSLKIQFYHKIALLLFKVPIKLLYWGH